MYLNDTVLMVLFILFAFSVFWFFPINNSFLVYMLKLTFYDVLFYKYCNKRFSSCEGPSFIKMCLL